MLIVIVFLFWLFIVSQLFWEESEKDIIENLSVEEMNEWKEDCVVPDWAKKMGHEDKWKLHNGCK